MRHRVLVVAAGVLGLAVGLAVLGCEAVELTASLSDGVIDVLFRAGY